MAPPKSPPPPLDEIRKALDAVDWIAAMEEAVAILIKAYDVGGPEAEQLVGDATEALYEGAATGKGRLWDFRKYPDIADHLVWVARSILSHADDTVLFDPTGEEMNAAMVNHPLQLLRKGATHKLGLDRREAALARMPDRSRMVYLAIEEGTFLPKKAFAKLHGLTIAQVDAARKTMKYHLDEVVAADEVEPPSSGSQLGAPPAVATRLDSGDDEGGTGYES